MRDVHTRRPPHKTASTAGVTVLRARFARVFDDSRLTMERVVPDAHWVPGREVDDLRRLVNECDLSRDGSFDSRGDPNRVDECIAQWVQVLVLFRGTGFASCRLDARRAALVLTRNYCASGSSFYFLRVLHWLLWELRADRCRGAAYEDLAVDMVWVTMTGGHVEGAVIANPSLMYSTEPEGKSPRFNLSEVIACVGRLGLNLFPELLADTTVCDDTMCAVVHVAGMVVSNMACVREALRWFIGGPPKVVTAMEDLVSAMEKGLVLHDASGAGQEPERERA